MFIFRSNAHFPEDSSRDFTIFQYNKTNAPTLPLHKLNFLARHPVALKK